MLLVLLFVEVALIKFVNSSFSFLSVQQVVPSDVPLSYSGSLGQWFATYQRYYEDTPTPVVPFRPPPVVPCQPIPCGVPVFCVVCGLRDTSPLTTRRIGHPALPYCLTGKYQQGVDRPPRFLNQPCVRMPRSKTPAGSTTPPSLSTIECCLPHKCKASASHNYTTFQDSMTQPAYLLLLCFTVILTASRAEFATSLCSLS